MDGALDRIASARESMERHADVENNRFLAAAVLIVEELRSSLDLRAADPLTVNLDDVYHYMSRQLVSADLHNRVATLDEVSDLLREVRSGWAAITYV
jgi:flagellar protein FliS